MNNNVEIPILRILFSVTVVLTSLPSVESSITSVIFIEILLVRVCYGMYEIFNFLLLCFLGSTAQLRP
jgi:hypothetical protein